MVVLILIYYKDKFVKISKNKEKLPEEEKSL